MFDREALERQKRSDAAAQQKDQTLRRAALDFVVGSDRYNYAYQFTWLGLPIIQLPQDVIAVQEVIWETKPDVIIETGVAWGGSIVLYASLLELMGGNRKVIGVDRAMPAHNSERILNYPFRERMRLIEGSSIDRDVFEKVAAEVPKASKVMVILDSNHTHEHVLEELRLYSPFVTPGQYLVVSDTIVEEIPPQTHRPRPWGPGRNPMTALREFLRETDRFVEDEYMSSKLLVTFDPGGYLRCVA